MAGGERTLLFTDIEGSTSLALELGDLWGPVLSRHYEIARVAFARHNGTEIGTEGDAFFVTFDDPADAVAACLETHLGLAAEEWVHGGEIRVRMGLHAGPVRFLETGEMIGMAIHEAARVASAAHGAQLVVTDVVARACEGRLPDGCSFRHLGEHRLKDIPDVAALYQLVHPDLPATFPPLRTLTAREHNLFVAPTEMVGRDALVDTVVHALIGDSRLVTLTGEGGIGKSRLAGQCAWQLLSWFRDGVWWVPFAAISDPSAIPAVIAATMGVDLGTQPALDGLAGAIGVDGTVLLVLDNLEHLGDGVTVLSDLLARCPKLRILATSRSRLRLRAERRIAVEPLSVPTDDTPAAVLTSETGQLLLARAEAVGAPVDLAAVDGASAAARICRVLDGMPLAVELAAARLDEYPITTLVDRLEGAEDLLTEGDRDLPPRQQALRAAVAWSEDALTDAQRAVFRAAGVFVAPFDAEALAAVTGQPVEEVDAALRRLVDVALLRLAGESPTGLRWTCLVPIRQYGEQRLRDDGSLGAAHERLVAEMGTRIRQESPNLVGDDPSGAMARLGADHANLHRALEVADLDERCSLASELSGRYFYYGGHARESLRIFEKLAEQIEADDPRRPQVVFGLVVALQTLGRHDDALSIGDATVPPDRALTTQWEILLGNLMARVALAKAGVLAANPEDGSDDARVIGQLRQLAIDRVGALLPAADALGIARVRGVVGQTAALAFRSTSQLERAQEAFEQLVDLWSGEGDVSAAMGARVEASYVKYMRGDHLAVIDDARDLLDEPQLSELLRVRAWSILAGSAIECRHERAREWSMVASDAAEDLGDAAMRMSGADMALRAVDTCPSADGDRDVVMHLLERLEEAARELGLAHEVASALERRAALTGA